MTTTKQILESLLFASDAPVGLSTLVEVLDGPDAATVAEELAQMARDYEESERGVTLAEIAGGYQLLSKKECAPWIDRMLRSRRKVRLSRAGLETLAIVAYKQPVTKVEIDSIRGVDSSGSLHTLLERGLVAIKGRSKGVGRPLVYATSTEFLSYIGINDLSDLPELKELGPVLEERERLEMEPDATAEAVAEGSSTASPDAEPAAATESADTEPEPAPEGAA
ncbi:MAG TPA: SMC-Scp complex subunit ScpB [Candidatus Eisenbacteria bacterium]|nr:SMC-Scp complex subunit ScpB [Candidatus Eisenbacteria bacterium]